VVALAKKLLNRVVVDPKIMAGKPVIKGTRVPVDLILKLLAQGEREEEILKDYPNLTKDDVRAALWYGSEVIRSEEIFPLTR
jgi:uncharacterized protein (DUF433 family)